MERRFCYVVLAPGVRRAPRHRHSQNFEEGERETPNTEFKKLRDPDRLLVEVYLLTQEPETSRSIPFDSVLASRLCFVSRAADLEN